jgi:cell division protein FtsB
MKWINVTLALLLCVLQYVLWFADGGAIHIWHLRQAFELQKEENDHLQERNHLLEVEIQDLRNAWEGIEERARVELGLIRPGETFYQIVE